jgi:cyclophilin family peptidyl-prolyl cis-trans isomerase
MMDTRPLPVLAAAIAVALTGVPATQAHAQVVRVTTPGVGSYIMELKTDETPITVANFLQYIESGRFDDTFYHRSLPGFIIQGGGFTLTPEQGFGVVPTFDPIVNEFDPSRSNLKYTVAMAKVAPEDGGGPDSATSGWFINLADNSANLDFQNGGFTVFAEVKEGMDVVDTLEALSVITLTDGVPPPDTGVLFQNLPLLDSWQGGGVSISDFVFTSFEVAVPGDTDFDGDVDDADLGIAFANYTGPVADGGKGFADGDTDFDGDVDDADLGIAFANYTGPLAAAAVPEPTSAALLGLAGLALVRRRRA